MMTISRIFMPVCAGVLLSLGACTTVSFSEMTKTSHPNKTTKATTTPILNQDIANKLTLLKNEVRVNNILYVTQDDAVIDGVPYVLLNFHTADKKIYRTRAEFAKMNAQHTEQLKKLKEATFIGVLGLPNTTNEFFFKNFKNLKF
ncbi:MAG: hypothetical protein Q4D05_05625 [Acinetobacter sp.]|nr:hypothetical protein [Acinetobacter sp.]